jgi:uncharacterized membrane protein
MSSSVDRARRPGIHPLHAFLLACGFPLFLGALLSDIAYAVTYHVQWTNFASWLIAGGLVFLACALFWALVDVLRNHRQMRSVVYVLLLLVTWITGFINALIHARDAWAAMPAALVLSAVVLLLIAAAAWTGFSSVRSGGVA